MSSRDHPFFFEFSVYVWYKYRCRVIIYYPRNVHPYSGQVERHGSNIGSDLVPPLNHSDSLTHLLTTETLSRISLNDFYLYHKSC